MDPTNPETQPAAEAKEPVAPEQQAPSIPKERLDQEIAKRKDAEAQLARLNSEIESLKKQSAPKPTQTSQTSGNDQLLAKVQQIEEREHRRELQEQLSLGDPKQAEAVQAVLRANPELKPSEALTIASTRNAELFGGTDQRAFNPGQHGSLRPTGGGPPKVETLKDRVKKIAEMPPILREQAEKKLHGKLLADTLGWQYPT